MGTISSNKLGGICLIVGPLMATVLFVLFFVILSDSSLDKTDFSAVATDVASAHTIQQILLLLPPIGLVLTIYGLSVLYGIMRNDGNGEALFRLGLFMFGVDVIGTVIVFGLHQAIGWIGAEAANIAASSSAISLYAGMIGATGVMLISLALSSRDEFNKIFAYTVALVFLISVLVHIVAIVDTSQWTITEPLIGVSYIIVSIWSITIGLNLFKRA